MIFAGAVPPCVPKRPIEFGGKRQFAKKIADGGLIEHAYFDTETQSRRDFLFSPCLCDSVATLSFRFSNQSAGGWDPDGFRAIGCQARRKYPR